MARRLRSWSTVRVLAAEVSAVLAQTVADVTVVQDHSLAWVEQIVESRRSAIRVAVGV